MIFHLPTNTQKKNRYEMKEWELLTKMYSANDMAMHIIYTVQYILEAIELFHKYLKSKQNAN